MVSFEKGEPDIQTLIVSGFLLYMNSDFMYKEIPV